MRVLCIGLALISGLCAIAAETIEKPKAQIRALDELRVTRTAITLGVDRSNAASLLELVQPVFSAWRAYAEWADKYWAEHGEAVQTAIKQWASGGGQEAAGPTTARQMLEEYRKRRQGIDERARKAAASVLKKLNVAAGTVENEAAAIRRRTAERQFRGARNAAEFVLMAAEALRQLMPDDYVLVRFSEAQRLAEVIAQAPPRAALVGTILALLDDLVHLPPQAFVDQRQQLLAEIATRLGQPAPAGLVPAVSWDELVQWLKEPQTYQLLQRLAGKTPSATVLVPKQFVAAVQQTAIIEMVARLQMSHPQVRVLAQLLASLSEATRQFEADREQIGEKASDLLDQVRKALTEGKPLEGTLADQVKKVLAADDEAINSYKIAVHGHIMRFRRILAPAQRALIDWAAPGEVLRHIPPQVKMAELRRRAAMIADAIQFLNSIKYQLPKKYMNVKVPFTRDFVSRFIDPATPEFDTAMQFALGLVAEARFVPREEWEGGANVEYATRLLLGLGVLSLPMGFPLHGEAMYSWRDLYEMFSSSGADELAKIWLEGGR